MTVPYDTMSTTSIKSDSIFSKCCCCIPLRIGCFILGYFNLILNSYHTLLLILGIAYVGISTNGFHFDDIYSKDFNQDPDEESSSAPLLSEVAVVLIVIICAKLAWLAINIACLVGLHKRNPGPIRVYVGFATTRLVLSLFVFIHQITYIDADTKWSNYSIASYSVDLGLSAYFILVYYIYAGQLKREQEQGRVINESTDTAEKDISFIYPTKTDQKYLIA